MHNKPIAAGKSSYDLLDQDKIFAELKLGPDTVMLDLASGAGNYTLAAAELIGEGKIYALDLWQEGIAALNEEASARGLNNIEAVVADAGKEIPLADSSVDLCLIATALHDLVEVNAGDGALKEVARVLKPGGRLVVIEFKKVDGPPGPPVHIRLSSEELDGMVLPFGYLKEHTLEVGEYNYLTAYKKR